MNRRVLSRPPDDRPQHTAAVKVALYPSGVPGQVLMEATQDGPEFLTPSEAKKVLRDAARLIDPIHTGMGDDDEQITMARIAYQAYGDQTGWKNYQGNAMPQWDDLGDSTQRAWIAAGDAVAGYLMGPPASDELGPDDLAD